MAARRLGEGAPTHLARSPWRRGEVRSTSAKSTTTVLYMERGKKGKPTLQADNCPETNQPHLPASPTERPLPQIPVACALVWAILDSEPGHQPTHHTMLARLFSISPFGAEPMAPRSSFVDSILLQPSLISLQITEQEGVVHFAKCYHSSKENKRDAIQEVHSELGFPPHESAAVGPQVS
ncbi:uncharacterized protein [Manis javanica]|uniref:uncharacterized protein isoform X2 n=1 Tax=Manis javanica TaxID=9974 RepID=UPI003C6D8B80